VRAPGLICGVEPAAGGYDADIIILSFGRLFETMAAVRSALGQTGVAAHVSVLDQGSPAAEVELLVAAFRGERRLALYRGFENLGVAGGRNFLSAAGHGRVIIGLDNDAVFAGPDVAARAVAAFAEPGLGALGFGILNGDGSGLDESSWGYPQGLKGRRQFTAATFVGAGHAIRRAAFEAAGGYDDQLFFTWEEYDVSRRMIVAGWRIAYDGGLAVWHKGAKEKRVSWGGERGRYFVRNRIVVARKWREPVWVLVAFYLLKGLLEGRLGAAMQGIGQGLRWKISERFEMSRAMRDYIFAHETAHRGKWLQRLQYELLRPRELGRGFPLSRE
jgi:GT2 family glycosyltransferase